MKIINNSREEIEIKDVVRKGGVITTICTSSGELCILTNLGCDKYAMVKFNDTHHPPCRLLDGTLGDVLRKLISEGHELYYHKRMSASFKHWNVVLQWYKR